MLRLLRQNTAFLALFPLTKTLPKKLLDRVREVARLEHDSIRTKEAHVNQIFPFIGHVSQQFAGMSIIYKGRRVYLGIGAVHVYA